MPKGFKAGGRQKGTPNKDTLQLEDKAKALGCDVFETAIYFASGNWKALGYESEVYHMEKPDGAVTMGFVITPQMRLLAIKELLQYIYPKKKTVEVGTSSQGFKIIIEDYSKK